MKIITMFLLYFTCLLSGKSQNQMYERIGDSELEFIPSERFPFDKQMDWYGKSGFCFSFLVIPMDVKPNPDTSRKPLLSAGFEVLDSMTFTVESKSIPLYLVKKNYMPGIETIEAVSVFDDTKNLIMLNANFEDLKQFSMCKDELIACLSTMRKRKC
ncbi:MAG: hypothetical protein IPN76_21250 [Saprospiraceae bacterium]|jgi:hypothetical protein|nr:hypothetical protein [Saprospiraceae bacterium]